MFEDRHDAGKQLGRVLRNFKTKHTVVCAIPRGGVPVGSEVAKIVHAPFDIIVVRKLGAPGQPELGIGAVSRSVDFLNDSLIDSLHVTSEYIVKICAEEKQEVLRREEVYRNGKPSLDLQERIVIVVDDGLATGVTAKTALLSIAKQHPKKIIYASPVCARHEISSLSMFADSVVCVLKPDELVSVGQWYKNFSQTTDEEVMKLLSSTEVVAAYT